MYVPLTRLDVEDTQPPLLVRHHHHLIVHTHTQLHSHTETQKETLKKRGLERHSHTAALTQAHRETHKKGLGCESHFL